MRWASAKTFIRRVRRGLADQRIDRSVIDFALDDGDAMRPIIGRLVACGLDDELRLTSYAVIDGVDGRAHHVRLVDLDATSDVAPGGIVELRRSRMRPAASEWLWRFALTYH